MNSLNISWPTAATVVAVCQLVGIILRLVTEWLALRRAVLDRKADQRKKLRERGRPRIQRNSRMTTRQRKRLGSSPASK